MISNSNEESTAQRVVHRVVLNPVFHIVSNIVVAVLVIMGFASFVALAMRGVDDSSPLLPPVFVKAPIPGSSGQQNLQGPSHDGDRNAGKQ